MLVAGGCDRPAWLGVVGQQQQMHDIMTIASLVDGDINFSCLCVLLLLLCGRCGGEKPRGVGWNGLRWNASTLDSQPQANTRSTTLAGRSRRRRLSFVCVGPHVRPSWVPIVLPQSIDPIINKLFKAHTLHSFTNRQQKEGAMMDRRRRPRALLLRLLLAAGLLLGGAASRVRRTAARFV